jgi:hypothetical protein
MTGDNIYNNGIKSASGVCLPASPAARVPLTFHQIRCLRAP